MLIGELHVGGLVMVTTRDKIYLAIVAVLVLVILALANRFILSAPVVEVGDGRRGITLEHGEHALVLREMRSFLSGLQQLVDALANDDMHEAAKAGRSLARAAESPIPGVLSSKLPVEYKLFTRSIQHLLDRMAVETEWAKLPKRTLSQVAEVIQTCVACHEKYRVVVASAAAPAQAHDPGSPSLPGKKEP
ncbi:MAG: hypothetical protein IT514_04120 [Burkholderiales bacterium]|nr:hypothetical protein [Burkholderiales bacterium]